MSYHKFQGSGEFAFVVSDAKADSKSVSTRGFTEPEVERARELGPEPAALEARSGPAPGAVPGETRASGQFNPVHRGNSTRQQSSLHRIRKKELSDIQYKRKIGAFT